MTSSVRLVVVLAVLTMGCEVGERPPLFIIPGPTVPSPLPTAPPYIWDTREELAIWVNNPVARGPLALEGAGTEAFIRIDRAEREWVLRGPDLTPPASGVRGLRIRYRWRPDPDLPPPAAADVSVTASFQTTTPIRADDPTAQGTARAILVSRSEWTDITFTSTEFTPAIDVEYCYVHSLGANRGVLEIDRIQLIQ